MFALLQRHQPVFCLVRAANIRGAVELGFLPQRPLCSQAGHLEHQLVDRPSVLREPLKSIARVPCNQLTIGAEC